MNPPRGDGGASPAISVPSAESLARRRCSDGEAGRRSLPASALSLSLLLACLLIAAWVAPDELPEQGPPDLSVYPWLYLRDGDPLVAGAPILELLAVGDVMLGRGVVDEPFPFSDVASWL